MNQHKEILSSVSYDVKGVQVEVAKLKDLRHRVSINGVSMVVANDDTAQVVKFALGLVA